MVHAASDRIRFGVDCLDLQADGRVLEIGCGHGVARSLIAERLETGIGVGIDRSAKMVQAATTRNQPPHRPRWSDGAGRAAAAGPACRPLDHGYT
ncbi:MAG: methyltransferase domain-containing protein [Chloroflexota bacterium]|nr:methyltransferase domain-containing protein [Chloroflexota bacterium]